MNSADIKLMMEYIIINICTVIKLKCPLLCQMTLLNIAMELRLQKNIGQDITTFLMWSAEPHLETGIKLDLGLLCI